MDALVDYRDFIHRDAELHDIAALNRREERSLYATRQKVHPKLAHGAFRRLKWILMAVTLAIYYAVPWLRWNRGPDLPDQAVLLDMEHERFFLFGLEIWPQEFYYVTGLLVLAALTLFLITALAGRVWCGYFCPQTVWTDLMIAVERFWQGDRSARIRLDKEPWSVAKAGKKILTHLSWLMIGMATGGAFVFYFADAPILLGQLLSGTAPETAYVFIGIFTATTYVLGGIAREQVCIYMCPWPRIQGAMIDKDSYLVSYRDWRGEPRGQKRKTEAQADFGDCIDCKACIAVCPMSIDIRDGAQLECIQCGLCIDACNDIMKRVDKPSNLITYATISGLAAEMHGASCKPNLMRPRTLLYAALIAVVGLVMTAAFRHRTALDISILPDRNPIYVTLSDGSIRNGYTVKILNKLHEPRSFEIAAVGLPDARIALAGLGGSDNAIVSVATDAVSEQRVFVSVAAAFISTLAPHAQPFSLTVRDTKSGHAVRHETTFRRP